MPEKDDADVFLSVPCLFRPQEVKGTPHNCWLQIGEFHHYLERQEQGQQDYLLSYTHSNK